MIIKSSVQKGFTLIELMITVTIIGILSAVALPAYQDYSVRAQVSEGLQLAGGVQMAIATYYATDGSFPSSLAATGLNNPVGKYASNIDSNSSIITITYGGQSNSKVNGKTVTLTAADTGSGVIQWVCAKGTIDQKYLASSCI